MGFRFRRSIKILPGIRLNIGKRGVSTSVGVRGAHVTLGKSGTRTTVGIPGSGLSYTHLEKPHHEAEPLSETPRRSSPWLIALMVVVLIFVLMAVVRALARP
jgi:hypothetical protein